MKFCYNIIHNMKIKERERVKKIKNWKHNIGQLGIMLLLGGVYACLSAVMPNEVMRTLYSAFGLPILMALIYRIMDGQLRNHFYNVDVLMSESAEGVILWKRRGDNSTEGHYISVENTGSVDIFCVYVKLTLITGNVLRFHIPEKLKTEECFILYAPCKRTDIIEITITSAMQADSRTKKFSGLQTGKNGVFIFSQVESLSQEKYAIFNEVADKEIEKLERFWV